MSNALLLHYMPLEYDFLCKVSVLEMSWLKWIHDTYFASFVFVCVGGAWMLILQFFMCPESQQVGLCVQTPHFLFTFKCC